MAQEKIQEPSDWSPRQIMLATLFVVVVAAGFWLIYRFRAVLFILFVAILVGTAIKPAVKWLNQRGLKRIYAEILIFVLLLSLVVGFIVLVLPMVLEQTTTITTQLSDIYQSIRTYMLRSPNDILQELGARMLPEFSVETVVPETEAPTEQPAEAGEATTDRVAQLFKYLGIAARTIFGIVAVMLVSFYWSLEGDRAVRSVLLLFPRSHRENIREIFDASETRLGGFLLGQATLMLVVGVLQLIAYLLIGLPNALVLAIIAGILEAVPTIGPILGAIPAILVAANTSPEKIIWVIISTTIIQQLENNLLVPRIMGRSVGVNPLLTLLALAAFSSLFGILGALLAVPVAAILQLLADRLVLQVDEVNELETGGRSRLSLLRYQAREIAQDTRKQVRHKEQDPETSSDQLENEIESLALELDRILEGVMQEAGEI